MSSVMQVFIYKKNKADEVLDVTVPCNQILDEPAQGFFFRIDFSSCYPTIYLDYFDFEGSFRLLFRSYQFHTKRTIHNSTISTYQINNYVQCNSMAAHT